MLELIRDNRSGKRLEIVVFTFNEERRVPYLLQYYGSHFDLVLLDDNSTDRTVEIAIEAGATVFRRIGHAVGESYFAHYVNEMSRSQLSFYLFADEFIAKQDLEAIEAELSGGAAGVLCSKAEWVYGHKMLTLNHTEPRGFRQGYARYIETLHANLQVAPPGRVCQRMFALHHLHLWSVQSYFGKIGLYSQIEIEQFRKSRRPMWRFFRRYIASLIGFPVAKAWREKGLGLPLVLFWILFDLTELTIAALTWIEQAHLKSPEEQFAMYARLYSDSPLDELPGGKKG